MRLRRSQPPADEHTTALVRARMAKVVGDGQEFHPLLHEANQEEWGLVVAPEPDAEDSAGVVVARFSPAESPPPTAEDASRDRRDDNAPTKPSLRDALDDRMPLLLQRGRAGLERGQVAVVVLVVLLGAAVAVILFGLARPEIVPIESEIVSTGTPVSPTAESSGNPGAEVHPPGTGARADGPMLVHVAGLVAEPGVVEIPAGSRVIDAIEAAGGPTAEADLTPINLARVLSDGEQVLVTSEPVAAPANPANTGPADGGRQAAVNLNTATAAELETLPGIGPALAARILQWRAENGRFNTVEELREVSGIGERRLAELEDLVTL